MSKDIPVKLSLEYEEDFVRDYAKLIVEFRKPRKLLWNKKVRLDFYINNFFTDVENPSIKYLHQATDKTLEEEYKGDYKTMLEDVLKLVIISKTNRLNRKNEDEELENKVKSLSTETTISLEDLKIISQ